MPLKWIRSTTVVMPAIVIFRIDPNSMTMVAAVQRFASIHIPFHIAPNPRVWCPVSASFEVVLFPWWAISVWQRVSRIVISKSISQIIPGWIIPTTPYRSMRPRAALSRNPHIGAFTSDDIFPPTPSPCAFLFLISWPNETLIPWLVLMSRYCPLGPPIYRVHYASVYLNAQISSEKSQRLGN